MYLFIDTSEVDRHTELVVLHFGSRGGLGSLDKRLVHLQLSIKYPRISIKFHTNKLLLEHTKDTHLVYHRQELASWLKEHCICLNTTQSFVDKH